MSLSAATTISGGTLSVAGGSAVTWASLGLQGNKNVLVVPADSDLRIRRSIDAVVKQPSVQVSAPNGYTQARASVFFRKPKLLANGKITVNTAKIELSYDVETTAAEVQDLLDTIGQATFDADITPVFKQLNLA